MICISTDHGGSAWENAFCRLWESGERIERNCFYKSDCAAIEIVDPTRHRYSKHSPLGQERIEAVCHFLVNGDRESEVDHEWSKLYRRRLFEEYDEIGRIIQLLRSWPDCPRAQISLWRSETDYQRESIAPCLQILWFKINNDRLDLHVHMRTSDCYGKLLLNINEFIALQEHVAVQLSPVRIGIYRQFVDSLHFHEKDSMAVDALYRELVATRDE
jgi:thymidylate synthase